MKKILIFFSLTIYLHLFSFSNSGQQTIIAGHIIDLQELASTRQARCNRELAGKKDHRKLYLCDLSNKEFIGAYWPYAILYKANFNNTDLLGAQLAFAKLQGVDLSKTKNLHTSQLYEAEYNDETKFPPGFDPESKHMVKVD